MGETGLIKQVLFTLDKTKDCETIYLDIYDTSSLIDFINKFGSALLQIKETFSKKLKRKTNDFIRNTILTVIYNALTGSPSFSFYIENEQMGYHTLTNLFAYLKSRSKEKTIVVAIDEFQQIASYPNTNLEASFAE